MQIYKSLKELPSENWMLFLSIFINRLGNMSLVFLVLYLHTELHYSITMAALIFAIYGFTSLWAGPLGGWLTDYFGTRPTMITSMFCNSLILFIYPWVHHLIFIIILTVCWSLSCEIFRPANMVAVTQFCSASQSKTAYALNRLAINLGMSIGPVIGGIIAGYYFGLIFIINSLGCLATALIIVAYPPKSCPRIKLDNAQKNTPTISSFLNVLSNSYLCILFALFCMVSMIFYQHTSTMSLFMVHDLHLTPKFLGYTFAINTLLIVLFEVPLNLATSEWHIKTTMALGSMCTAIGFGLFAFCQNFMEVSACVVIWTFGEMLIFPGIAAYVSNIAPSHQRGAYMGIYQLTSNLALMLGPLCGTYLMANLGATHLWIICFLWGLTAAVLFYYLSSKTASRNLVSTVD